MTTVATTDIWAWRLKTQFRQCFRLTEPILTKPSKIDESKLNASVPIYSDKYNSQNHRSSHNLSMVK